MRPVVLRAGAWRLLLLTGVILGMLGLGAVEAHAAAPSSLAGETFTIKPARESTSTLTGTCPQEQIGVNGSFKYSVSGTAAGPFPGSFRESGSFTTDPKGFLTGFSSTFTITSTAGTVTGTKSLSSQGDPSVASCVTGLGQDKEIDVSVVTTYRATIPGGGQDTGTATMNVTDDLAGGNVQVLSLGESFGSAGAPPPPTSKAQCKDGGWRSFGTMFKNQGDCISYVVTGGKNTPSGSGRRRA